MPTREECQLGIHTADNQGLCWWCGEVVEHDWYDNYNNGPTKESKSMPIYLPSDNTLRAITIREPFATLIAMGFKTVENRISPWPKTLPLPCTLAIHAGFDDGSIYDDICEVCQSDNRIYDAFDLPGYEGGVNGRSLFYSQTIIGLVDVVACVDINDCKDDAAVSERLAPWPVAEDSIASDVERAAWANGPYCYILENPRRFRRGIMVSGQLGLWRVAPSVQAIIQERAQDCIDVDTLILPPTGGVSKPLGKRLAR